MDLNFTQTNKIILETERTYVVTMNPSHADVMAKLFEIKKNEALLWIDQNVDLQNQKEFSDFNIFDKKTGNYIGYSGCHEIKLKDNTETQLSWSIYKKFKEDDIDIEVVFAVRNYMFKHFNINSLISIIPVSEPQDMNVAEAIDMENEYSFLDGFHKFYVYIVNRSSEKFKASFGDGESGAKLTSTFRSDENRPSLVRNLRRPRPRPR